MIELTKKEQEALLIIYKDFTSFYNATSLSKELGITQVGAMKLLNRLKKYNIVQSKKIGKSIIYKVNIKEGLTKRLIGFILINEARKHERWYNEFKTLYDKSEIVLFYGSASRDYSNAKDIDIMMILKEKNTKIINKILQEVQNALPKKLHVIKATKEDLNKNIKNNNEAIIEIIKTAIVLHGYDEYMEIINGYSSF